MGLRESDRYGAIPWEGAVPVTGQRCVTWDLRAVTGQVAAADESTTHDAGHAFTLSVYAPTAGELPTAEVRFMLPTESGLREVSLVGALTGRPGVVEVTPAHLAACMADPAGYLQQMQAWIGVVK